jgi:DNA invertase Pin-like site-specific DNA recombinase
MRIGYARVSTRTQDDRSQLDLLEAAGCERIYRDVTSGKLARRPDWDRCLEQLRRGDQLVITRLSRMARSVHHLTEVAALLADRGVDLVVVQQGIDTTTPAGRLLFHVLGAFDEFLADLISEGTHEGLAAAKARGRAGGRRPVMTPAKLATARQLVDAGEHTITEIAGIVGVGRATLYRHLELQLTSGARPGERRSVISST